MTSTSGNNPFLRFKHYRTDQKSNDARENHATESLAACLVFSDVIRAEFLNFLFENEIHFTPEKASAFLVSTQAETSRGKWVDLLLEEPDECAIVVEVKVRAPEDGIQIKEYVQWLSSTKKGEHYVFSLVQNPDGNFDIRKFGGKRRSTWRELTDLFKIIQTKHAETDAAVLAAHLCNYLEAEGIMSNWTPKEIAAYASGIKAKHAVETLFNQVATQLTDRDQDFTTRIVIKDDQWPRLEIGRTTWESIFGKLGYLNRLHVFYETTAAWGGEEESFYFELQLWNKYHQADWSLTRKSCLSGFRFSVRRVLASG